MSYTYDAAGNVASIVSSNTNGINISYTYDELGRLWTVVDNRLTGNNTTTYSYDAGSNLKTAAYPNYPSNEQSTFTYDSLDRLTGLSTPVSSYSYQLGLTGNRTGVTEGTTRTVAWNYDGIYRLTNETIGSDPANKDGSVTYSLDPVGERAVAWLDKYLDQARPRLVAEPDDGTLFLTAQGEPFGPNRLSGLVRDYVEAAGIGKHGACHLFRHTMATLMLEGGADIRFIQQMLGHARLDTTEIYTHVSIRMLKQIHAATHPAASLVRSPEAAAKPADSAAAEALFSALEAEAKEEE